MAIGRHPVVTFFVVGLLIIIGYILYLVFGTGGVIKPDTDTLAFSAGEVTATTVSANVSVQVQSHLPFPVNVDSIQYIIAVAGDTILTGTYKGTIVIGALSNDVLTLPVSANKQELMIRVAKLKGGNSEVKAFITPYTTLPLIGVVSNTTTVTETVLIPTLPTVELVEISSDSLNQAGGTLQLKVKIKNENAFPVTVNGLAYTFSISNREMVRDSLALNYDMRKTGEQLITIPVKISYQQIGEVAMRMLFQPSATNYKLSGLMHIDAENELIGKVAVPVEITGTVDEFADGMRR